MSRHPKKQARECPCGRHMTRHASGRCYECRHTTEEALEARERLADDAAK